MVGKRLVNTGGAVAAAGLDPLQNFETVTYTGNGGTQKITGYIRKGAAFNGSSSRVSLPSSINTNYITPTGSFSASTWVNFNTVGTAEQQIICFNTAANLELSLNTNSNTGKIVMRIYKSGASPENVYLVSTTTVSANTWYHVAITYNNGSWALYINGSSEDTGTQTLTQPTTNIFLGERLNNSQYLNGKIDQVRIFNTALDSTQVGELALETYADPKKSITDYFGDGHGVALYELDEDASDTGVYTVGQGDIDSGQSADFNGGSEAYNTSVASNLTGDYSFGFYVKFDSLPTEGGLMGIYTPNTSNGTSLAFANGNLLLNCGNSQTATSIPSSFWEVNKWYHIAVTHDNGGDVKLYVNNVLSKTLTTTSTTIQSGSTLILGRSSRTSSGSYNYVQRLDGQMDEVRIYNDVLTSTEVGYLAANDSVNIPTGNLVAHYKLDGNGNDQTNNNYSLTWSGTQLYSTNAEFPFNQYNGTPTNVNFLGMAFQPDFVWIKNRDDGTANHYLIDSVRGIGSSTYKFLSSDLTTSENTTTLNHVNSIDSNGFTVQSLHVRTNKNGDNYVAWCWKAGGAAVSNTDGSITSTVSANQDAGFSIVKWNTGTGTNSTVGHGLSSAPELVLYKSLSTRDWIVYSLPTGINQYLRLNTTAAAASQSNIFATPTTTTFPSKAGVNVGSSEDYIAYCFHSVDGYQKVGSYTGIGGATGSIVQLGFKPRWLMIKGADTTYASNWFIWDSERDIDTPNNSPLQANQDFAELTNNIYVQVDLNDTSFQIKSDQLQLNESGKTYIYLAIA